MAIRPYQKADFERLAEIYNQSKPDEFYGEEGEFNFTPWAEDEYMMSLIDDSKIYVYEDQSILGFCGLTNNRVNWLCVAPNYRGMGIAEKLLSCVLLQYGQPIKLSVLTSNARAKRLYIKKGFRVIGELYIQVQGGKRLVNTMCYP